MQCVTLVLASASTVDRLANAITNRLEQKLHLTVGIRFADHRLMPAFIVAFSKGTINRVYTKYKSGHCQKHDCVNQVAHVYVSMALCDT